MVKLDEGFFKGKNYIVNTAVLAQVNQTNSSVRPVRRVGNKTAAPSNTPSSSAPQGEYYQSKLEYVQKQQEQQKPYVSPPAQPKQQPEPESVSVVEPQQESAVRMGIVWEYYEQNEWKPYHAACQKEIEKHFGNGKTKCWLTKGPFEGTKVYFANFARQFQKHAKKEGKLPIRRVVDGVLFDLSGHFSSNSSRQNSSSSKPTVSVTASSSTPSASSPAPTDGGRFNWMVAEWMWKSDDDWTLYEEDQSKDIEWAYQKKKKRVHLTKGFFKGKEYMIDFPHMVQVSLQGGQRRVKREIKVRKQQ
eukprot:TRINITY_DN904_c0_g2_i2.p1 TRINITY_DN904_c0_g2~~TRINITY_DN904_c0_g2_i2.p1  ORF type:complete len:303 (-),score=96.42 TRINITY_DN904_c0_g2_i2:75-983(-)